MVRKPCRAGLFYPGQPAACREQMRECLESARIDGHAREPVAAIVPHAGWVYSGPIAAGALRALAERKAAPEVVVLFGAVHVPGVDVATLSDAEAWDTPLGRVPLHVEGAERLGEFLAIGSGPHRGEHSLEVQVPFLQEIFPEARILPIAVPPDVRATEVGRQVAAALEDLGEAVVFVGSTDLSHYGYRFGFVERGVGAEALRWVKQENDARMIQIMRELNAEEAVPEADRSWNACGAGAIAATLAAARARGRSSGVLTGYTTSADVMAEVEPTDFVGYSGLVI